MRRVAVLLSSLTACDFIVGLDRNPQLDAPLACPPAYTNRYRYVDDGRSWTAAAQLCKDDSAAAPGQHTHLVVFSDVIERDAVRALAPDTRLWIGYADHAIEGTFQWVTDEPTLYAPPWNGTEPNGGTSENCVEMLEDGDTNDQGCAMGNAFVCECDGFPAVR